MARRYAKHSVRHEDIDYKFREETAIKPKCWKTGWEYKLSPEQLSLIEQLTHIKTDDPERAYRLCVFSGYSKAHREKVAEFARKPARVNVLRTIYFSPQFVIGEFYNGQYSMFGIVINKCNGEPSNPAATATTLPRYSMANRGVSCDVPMKTYLEKA